MTARLGSPKSDDKGIGGKFRKLLVLLQQHPRPPRSMALAATLIRRLTAWVPPCSRSVQGRRARIAPRFPRPSPAEGPRRFRQCRSGPAGAVAVAAPRPTQARCRLPRKEPPPRSWRPRTLTVNRYRELLVGEEVKDGGAYTHQSGGRSSPYAIGERDVTRLRLRGRGQVQTGPARRGDIAPVASIEASVSSKGNRDRLLLRLT